MIRLTLSILSALLLAACVHPPLPPHPFKPDVLGNPPGMVDRLDMFEAAEDWEAGELIGVHVVDDGILLGAGPGVLAKAFRRYPDEGRWISPVMEPDFEFTELLPSWNVEAPPDTGVRFEVRARDARSGEWSPWLHAGFWGRTTFHPERPVWFKGGFVNVDILILTQPANAYQIQAHLESYHLPGENLPRVRRIAVVHSGVVRDERRRAEVMEPVIIEGEWARDLNVPFIQQQSLGPPIGTSVCSPTSVTMVLHHWGIDAPLLDNAMAIYDPEFNLFGNWNRAVARPGELGLDAWLVRVRSMDQIRAEIARGQPVIASVVIERGDVTGLTYSGGHLVVIRGLTPEGDVIINDPFLPADAGGDGAFWRAEEFAHVWFDKGGVGYIIRPPAE
ncbi:C39 family peptidase [Candidatus Sumerlaeota bacterium]|nr:C39 family peptidase [Candidatus Sumerlaeota bacterium]